ncbi:MAG: FBP domain-containing protein [Archangium sp.]|nr:FBP domain-containing protein [Archangium sp.]
MFKLDSEDAVLATFRHKDRTLVELSSDLKFPIILRDAVTWTHPSGGRAYLVFFVPGGVPTGVVFDTSSGSGEAVPHMCEWCHRSGSGTEIGLLTARINAKKLAGIHLCSDLRCKEKLEEQANLAGSNVKPAIEKLVARMGRFASEVLKIDLSGVTR